MTNAKKNRYDPDNLPLSKKTREGLSVSNIDQLKAISVMFRLQDDVYMEMFTEIKTMLLNHERRITELEKDVANIKVLL